MALQHLRSSTANKRPVPGNMSDGQLGINTNDGSPGLFFKDSNNALVKVGPVHVGTTAPNASPASGGTAGNSVGEQWLDTTGGTYVFKVWDGSAWRSESGTFVDVNGDVMTGALGIIAGSASAPGLYFSGDTNTGLYSPGADQVAISTGGSGRLFVDASGRVIVGAATAAIGTTFEIVGNTNGQAIGVRGRSSDNIGIISFHPNASATEYARIQSNGDSSLSFGTGSSGSERLRITSAGLVGIGTSSPSYPLSVKTTTNGGQAIFDLDNDDAGNYGGLRVSLGNNDRECRLQATYGSSFFTFYTEGATGGPLERLRITSAGNVGIGATSPSSKLQVASGDADGINIDFNGGIATGSEYSALRFTASLYGFTGAEIRGIHTNGGLNLGVLGFHTSGSERARIDSSGRLLVGTSSARGNLYNTTATSPLQVEGTNDNNNSILITMNQAGVAGPRLDLAKSRGSSVGSNTVVVADDYLGTISFQGSDGTEFVAGAYIQAAVDGTPGANDMPGRLMFSTTADGASSPTERMRIDSTGRCFFNTTASPSTTSFGTAIGTVLAHSRDTSTGAVAQIYGNAGEFRIIGSGNAQNTNNSYGAISDQSLKTDISDAGSQWDDIKGITVRKFKLIGTDTLQIGVVAQECELVSPGLVEDTVLEQEDGTTSTVKAVKYSVLYMKAVKALQEAMERIEQLEQRLAAAGI